MPRPKLNASEKKNERLTVRFRPEEQKQLSAEADTSGLCVSELVRRRALRMRVVPITDLKMISELRRIGGLIKHMFNETNGLYQHKTSVLLDELHSTIVCIGRQREEG